MKKIRKMDKTKIGLINVYKKIILNTTYFKNKFFTKPLFIIAVERNI